MTPQPLTEAERQFNLAKLTAFRYQFWVLSCQFPRDVWDKPEEESYQRARVATSDSVEKTDWARIKKEFEGSHIWLRAIELAKTSLGITTEGK